MCIKRIVKGVKFGADANLGDNGNNTRTGRGGREQVRHGVQVCLIASNPSGQRNKIAFTRSHH